MGTGINRLPASFMKLKAGYHSDGNNLYFQTDGPKGRHKSWIFRYQLTGQKTRDMGLGSASYVSLADARELARKFKALTKQGIDPIATRDAEVKANLAANAPAMTFDEGVKAYIEQHGAAWSAGHAADWKSTLNLYASPVLGRMPLRDIDTPHVMRVLDPIWKTKTPTAKRVQNRIEQVLDWARVLSHRSGENPARWAGHLKNLLAAPSKVHTVKHFTALPHDQMPAFIAELRQRESVSALALEFLALTCVRLSDVLDAKHAAIDLAKRVWTISALTKTGKVHPVPLSDAALSVIERAGKTGGKGEHVFTNDVTGARLHQNATAQLLVRMGRNKEMTAHGLRASFRTWAQDTNFAWELCELCLGHTVATTVERAYARGDGFQKRVAVMQAWANFLDHPIAPADVVPLHRRKHG
jgi:integrase